MNINNVSCTRRSHADSILIDIHTVIGNVYKHAYRTRLLLSRVATTAPSNVLCNLNAVCMRCGLFCRFRTEASDWSIY